MPTYSLRPLALGELLDVSFGLYRRLLGTLVTIALITGGIPLVISLFIEQAGGAMVATGPWLLNALLSLMLGALGTGASTYVVSQSYLGEETHAGAALGRMVPYLGRIILLSILTTILVFFGFMLLLIPGFIVACGLALSMPALVVEGIPGPAGALQRSWTLTRGYRGKVFLAMLVTFLIFSIPFVGLGMLAAVFGGGGLIFAIVTVALSVLITPLIYVTLTVLYYDLRVRKEGFDLEMLAQAVRA
jgi:hypothetical protein